MRHQRTSRTGASPWIWCAWFVVLALDIIALLGITRLEYDDGLIRSFQSDTARYQAFERFRARFPGLGQDTFLLLESDDFARPERLQAASDLVLELQLTDGVTGVFSAFGFSMPDGHGGEMPVLPDAPADGTGLAERLQSAQEALPHLSRFLSADRRSLLVVVQLAGEPAPGFFGALDRLGEDILRNSGVTMSQTGYLALRQEMVSRLFNDFILLNAVGVVAGTTVIALLIGSLTIAALTTLASGTALLWVLGFMGLAGTQINVITVALPVLILVLSFADALHLSFETRKQVRDGHTRAVSRSLRRIAPACVLASVTTAIAFGALALSPSALVAEMGRAGVAAALLAVAAVLIVHPMLMATLDRAYPLKALFAGRSGAPARIVQWTLLPEIARKSPGATGGFAAVALILSISLYLSAQPSFSLYDNFDADEPLIQTIERIERDLTPIGSMHFPVRIDPAQGGRDIARAATLLARHADGRTTLSLESLGAAAEPGKLPETVRSRFVSEDGTHALVTLPFSYRDGDETRRIASGIETALAQDPDTREAFVEGANGIEVVTAFVSSEMLDDINRSFLIAVAVSGLLIALWLRDPLAGAVALIPNVLPISLVGAWLAISGRGLEFSSGIALTIAFGLAIDDTVHLVNRLRLDLSGRIWGSPAQIIAATNEVLPALVITSAVLSFGLIGTQFASLPTVAYFGILSIAVFVLALMADLVLLPAWLILVTRWLNREKPR